MAGTLAASEPFAHRADHEKRAIVAPIAERNGTLASGLAGVGG